MKVVEIPRTMSTSLSSVVVQCVAYALLCVIWGSTFLVIKVGYGGLGPFNVAATRFLVAAPVFALLVPVLGAHWPRGRREWLLVVWVGAALFAGDYGFIYWAEQKLDSALTAMLFAVMPVITTIAAHFYLETEKLTWQKLLGTLLALCGVAGLLADRIAVDASQVWSAAAVVVAAVCASAAMLATKRYGGNLHPAALNAPAMLIGSVLLLTAGVLSGEHLALPSGAAWGAVLYLSMVGSVVAFLTFFWLLKKWSATAMSLINVVTPMVATVFGFMFRSEHLTPWSALGGALILGGVLITLRTQGRLKKKS
jgi:drug/metabolite transporter (DMT)-like permease